MRLLTDLNPDDLRLARDSAAVMVRFRAYLPPGGFLLVLIGRFRDDVLEAMDSDCPEPPKRGPERHALDELTSTEFDTLSGAVGILMARFADYMDDPALPRLLREFRGDLDAQRAERAKERAAL